MLEYILMIRILFSSLILFVLFTGCAKKPAPEPVPAQMTEAYLLKHMRTDYHAANATVDISTLGIDSTPLFMKKPAKIRTTLSAQITLGDAKEVSTFKPPKYLLLFSMRAAAWGGFTQAIDTLGKHHAVMPYTSYIRKGAFYDNFYIEVSRSWMETASTDDTELLILGPKGEVSVTIPAVYPRALLHFFDSGAYLDAVRGSEQRPK